VFEVGRGFDEAFDFGGGKDDGEPEFLLHGRDVLDHDFPFEDMGKEEQDSVSAGCVGTKGQALAFGNKARKALISSSPRVSGDLPWYLARELTAST